MDFILLRHVKRKRALRQALEALPLAWPGPPVPPEIWDILVEIRGSLEAPPGSDEPSSIERVREAVDMALAALPDRWFCDRYAPEVRAAVDALTASKDSP